MLNLPLLFMMCMTPSPARHQEAPQKLLHSIIQNEVAEVKRLLASGIDPNLRVKPALEDDHIKDVAHTDPQQPLLMVASRFGCNDDSAVVLALIKAGARPNVADSDGYTPLIETSRLGWEPTIAHLLAAGANVHAKDNTGKTALMHATSNHGQGVIAKLLAKGAKINEADKEGNTALMLAVTNAKDDRFRIYGEDQKAKTKRAAERYSELLVYLVAKGADPKLKNKQGQTALDIAKQIHSDVAVKVLTANPK